MSTSGAERRSDAGALCTGSRLAPADKLKREIQAVLTEELADDHNKVGHGRYDGFAYPAAEAYFHLAGGYDAGLQPTLLRYRGKSHWWLTDKDGSVIDLTLAPRETCSFPYDRGKPQPFGQTPEGISWPAESIVERIKCSRRDHADDHWS